MTGLLRTTEFVHVGSGEGIEFPDPTVSLREGLFALDPLVPGHQVVHLG